MHAPYLLAICVFMCGFIDETVVYIIKLAVFYLLEKVIAMRQWRGIISLVAAMAMIGGFAGCGQSQERAGFSKSPQSSQTATAGAGGEIGKTESEHHILPSSDVEELELRLESIGESTARGNLTLLGELHPTASYTERDGGRDMLSLQNQDELTFSDRKSYMLSVLCMGEGSVSIEWTLGTQSEQRNLECAPKIAETALGMSNVNAKSSTVKIVAKEGSKAEIAYRLDEIDKPDVIVD